MSRTKCIFIILIAWMGLIFGKWERKEIVRKKGLNAGTPNPSVLIKPRENHPNCTHDLYRVPKSGSTALYNAVQTDPALHRHICWRNGREWHKTPNLKSLRRIIVALRHPRELLVSHMRYEGYWTKQNTTIDTHQWLLMRMRSGLTSFVPGEPQKPAKSRRASLLTNYVRRHPRQDIYLCVSEAFDPIDVQLRARFKDEAIRDIPRENVNHRREGLDFDRADEQLLEDFIRDDVAVWNRYCSVT